LDAINLNFVMFGSFAVLIDQMFNEM
jgi:hypothetical protein